MMTKPQPHPDLLVREWENADAAPSDLLPVDGTLTVPSKIIATELGETGKAIRKKVNRAIQLLGMAKIVELVAKAKTAEGSMMIKDGSRPRTLGGCFFELLRQELGERMDYIQRPPKPMPEHKRKKRDEQSSQPPTTGATTPE
jgi:hypothetical protein